MAYTPPTMDYLESLIASALNVEVELIRSPYAPGSVQVRARQRGSNYWWVRDIDGRLVSAARGGEGLYLRKLVDVVADLVSLPDPFAPLRVLGEAIRLAYAEAGRRALVLIGEVVGQIFSNATVMRASLLELD